MLLLPCRNGAGGGQQRPGANAAGFDSTVNQSEGVNGRVGPAIPVSTRAQVEVLRLLRPCDAGA